MAGFQRRKRERDAANGGSIVKELRILRKGAISRPRKALESKGLGNLSNPEVLQHLKHMDIRQEAYSYQPEEELQLKVDEIIGKLDWNAALGPRVYGMAISGCGPEPLNRYKLIRR